jgi:hypothetical protein
MKINDIINEDASIGGTMAGNVASIPGSLFGGEPIRRNKQPTEYANSKKPGKTKFKQVKEK